MPEYEPHTTAIVADLPQCDFKGADCRGNKRYDARLSRGPWAHVCEAHFILFNCKLGLGFGQELMTQERVDAERALDQAAVLFLADPHNLFKQDVWLAAHHKLMDILEPGVQPAQLADQHPMRNHPAYKAIQKRLENERKANVAYHEAMRDADEGPQS